MRAVFVFHRAGGHCNHVFSLLYLLSHWFLLRQKEIPSDKTYSSSCLRLRTNLAERTEVKSIPVMLFFCTSYRRSLFGGFYQNTDRQALTFNRRVSLPGFTKFCTVNCVEQTFVLEDTRKSFLWSIANPEETYQEREYQITRTSSMKGKIRPHASQLTFSKFLSLGKPWNDKSLLVEILEQLYTQQ